MNSLNIRIGRLRISAMWHFDIFIMSATLKKLRECAKQQGYGEGKIPLIRAYRYLYKSDLVEAKNAVDFLLETEDL